MIPNDYIAEGSLINLDSLQTRIKYMIQQYGEWLIRTYKIRDGHPDSIYIINPSSGLVPADTVVFRMVSNNLYQPKGNYLIPSDTTNKWQPKGNYLQLSDTTNLIAKKNTVTAGTYTNATITIRNDGVITSVSSGSGGTSTYSPWTIVTGITKISDSLLQIPVGTWYKKGLPIKYRSGSGTEYYGIIHNILNYNSSNPDTLIISGAPVPASCDTLKYGDANRVIKYDFGLAEYWSNYPVSGTTADSLIYLHTGAEFRWGLSNAYLVQWAAVTRLIDVTAGTYLNVFKNNETLIGNYGLNMTYGNSVWMYSSPSYINTTNYNISYGDFIDLRMIRTDTTPDARNLTISFWFVLE